MSNNDIADPDNVQGVTAVDSNLTADEAPSTQINDLTQRLAQAEAKTAENWDAVLRARAEAENIRRRAERDLENAHKYALERFAQELLPIIDSLHMGIQAAQSADVAVEKLREGSELTLKMFETALAKFQVVAIDPAGQPFNPEQHQAVTLIESKDAAPNTVVTVLQKGYALNARLIRPAMVVVAKAAE
jgi:molecular chaperone GrpE